MDPGQFVQRPPSVDLTDFPVPFFERLRDGAAQNWLRDVARDYRVEADLVVNAFASTVCEWERDSSAKKARRWHFPANAIAEPELEELVPWEPLSETRATWLERVQDWTDDVSTAFAQAGYPLPLSKTSPEHFDWLVQHVVSGRTISALARETDCKRSSVKEPIRQLATLIGLTLPNRSTSVPPRSNK